MFNDFLLGKKNRCLKLFLPTVLTFFLFTSHLSHAIASDAHLKGAFGPLHNWPIIPIAMMLMPDGRVFAYGTTPAGVQNGLMHYSIWNPTAGTSTNAFQTLPNITSTDIFCAAQAHIPDTGEALLVGGDARVNTLRNYANSDVNIFDPATDSLIRQSQQMAFKRWYATLVTLPNGEHAVLGGRNDRFFAGSPTIPATIATYAPTPEVRSQNGQWRTLSTATSDIAYGKLGGESWNYPRAWVKPQGEIFILTGSGLMFKLNTVGTGTLTKYTATIAPGQAFLPTIMFSPGRVLSVRKDRKSFVVDINGAGQPVATASGNLAYDRQYGNLTILPDGRVWANGGSSTGNDLAGMVLESELWNPDTKTWIPAAIAATARLYHSASLLLMDGTVITGGGGAPGPLKQLNGEIYYPPYLFKADGSGEFAPRMEITDAPTSVIGWNQNFSVQATGNITRVTLVRAGAVTHTLNNEARFFDLEVPQAGSIVTVRTPLNANIAPPGFYMLFVWDTSGVPSIARMIQIG